MVDHEEIKGQCLSCEKKEARCEWKENRFLYGSGSDAVELRAKVPVWTCGDCGFAYADGRAEAIRDEAVRVHLEKKKDEEFRKRLEVVAKGLDGIDPVIINCPPVHDRCKHGHMARRCLVCRRDEQIEKMRQSCLEMARDILQRRQPSGSCPWCGSFNISTDGVGVEYCSVAGCGWDEKKRPRLTTEDILEEFGVRDD